ncbi:MAG: hypothetical protein JXR40_02695, partial [Pontiellaceae bacterium]|nr:hypothetical protein [Pontiellaceae bacterium]
MNPFGGANLPYEYSDITVGQRTDTTPEWARNLPKWSSLTYKEIIPRLQRIYTTQGKTDRVLELSLFQFDRIPGALADFNLLMNTAERHAAEGKTAEFYAWTETQAAQATNLTAKANLYWAMNHPEQTLAVLANAENTEQLEVWKSRFKNKSYKLFVKLLDLSLALDSTDSLTRMEKLELQPEPLTPKSIDTLERLLAQDAKSPFPRGKGTYVRTRFHNEYDLAYRLMQLYEKENRIDDLTALGQRVALGEAPFESIDKSTFTTGRSDEIKSDLNAILSLLIHYADARTLNLLSTAWSTVPDFPAKRQLARKQRGGFETSTTAAIPWANLPEGVTALVSSENVLSLGADKQYAYSGHPWGIAVYDHEGNAVTRIALGTAALNIETCGGKVWIGTPLGLYSIDPKTWSIALLPMNQDLAEWERDLDELSPSYYNGIYALAADDEFLWIGTSRDIRRLDLKTETLRIFSERELGQKSKSSWDKIWIEEQRVWAGGHDGTMLFDRATETWSKLLYQDAPVHITNNTKEPLSG